VSSFFIRPVGFPENERAWLEAILTIGRGMLRDEWRWTTEGSADVYLVAVESRAQWERRRAELPPDRLVACILPGLEIDAGWRIKRAPERLPSLHELTRTLNCVSESLAARPTVGAGSVPFPAAEKSGAVETEAGQVAAFGAAVPTPAETAQESIPAREATWVPPASAEDRVPVAEVEEAIPADSAPVAMPAPQSAAPVSVNRHPERLHPLPTTAAGGDVYDPEEYLIGVVREALADGVSRWLACADGGGTLLIEPEHRMCFVPGDKALLWPILSAPRSRIEVQLLTRSELARETVAAHAHGLAIGDLVFLTALIGSRGRLWIGCRLDEPVRLRQWPDLKPLPHYMEYVKLAAFMSGNTADIRTIAEHTGTETDKVVNFHNACGALDLLERGGVVSIRRKPIDAGVRNLYQQIARRLHGEA
jgi:hypothetical protein